MKRDEMKNTPYLERVEEQARPGKDKVSDRTASEVKLSVSVGGSLCEGRQ